MVAFDLVLSYFSRYKETRLLQSDGKVFFGRWKAPTIRLDGDEEEVQVTEEDRGVLDFISYRYYGTRELAWAIALVNGVSSIPNEVVPGLNLTMPKISRIEEALQKETDGE